MEAVLYIGVKTDIMEELFPQMMQALTAAASRLSGIPLIVPGREEAVADAMVNLQAGLIQLDGYLHFDYTFEAGLPDDVMQYTALLQEYEEACGEKIGYLLERDGFFCSSGPESAGAAFLEELLRGITADSNTVREGVRPYGAPTPSD